MNDEVIMRICCPQCGHSIVKVYESPEEPPLTTRTARKPSTPVEAQPTLARPFQVAVPLEDTD